MRSRVASAFFAHAAVALALVSVISVSAEAQEPPAPSALQASVSGFQIALSWGSAAPVTSYVVEAGSAPGLANLAQLDTGTTATSITVNAPGGVYFVRVRARNGSVIGLPSNEVMITVAGACNSPLPPAALSQSVSGGTVVLTWAPVAGATSYVIEAGSSPGLSNLANVDTGSAAASFSATAPPGIYYVRVRARNACGAGPASSEVAVTVGSPLPTTDWLSEVNAWRARAGLAPVAEEHGWSRGTMFHSRYLVKEEVSGAENPLSPWFTPEGEEARPNSQGFTSFDVNQVDAIAVEAWILNPFYAVRLLDPALARVGFGSYREAGGNIAMASYIDVTRGRDNPGAASLPVLFPAPGSTIPPTSSAFNNPTLGCPRGTACNLLGGWGGSSFTCGGLGGQYNGFPIILQFAPGTTPTVTAASLEGGGISTRVCAFTGATYTAFEEPYHTLGRRYLRERGAVVLLASRALPAGQTYTVSATVNGQVYQWSFRVQ